MIPRFQSAFSRGFAPPFRGSMWENCSRFQFHGGGYKSMPPEQDGHFVIDSAMQCKGPMTALLDPEVRYTHTIGATQVLKSMVGDAWVPYVLEHLGLPMLVLFEDDPKADLFCSLRLMETLRRHPVVSQMLKESKKENRHNVTGTWIKTLTSELLVAGLNDGNVSTLSWPVVWISEAWQHGNDGLLFKAFKRTDRYAETCKVLNESQAALAGSDLHRATLGAHPVPLEWQCPKCDGIQTWEYRHWSFKRPEDFKPREQKTVSAITIGGETAMVSEQPQPGSYAGMRWDDDDAKQLTISDRASSAHWECIWCGHHIHDTREERKALTKSYRQDYQLKSDSGPTMISPREVCFTIPFEAAWDNRFEKTVTNYLTAKAAKAHGNGTPLQDWFMAERALFYDPRLTQSSVNILTQYTNADIAGLVAVVMGVDCQQGEVEKRTGRFWWVIRGVNKAGDLIQLARGYATSWDDLIAIQRQHKVPNNNVAIDGGQYLQEILDRAALHFEEVERDILNVSGKPTGKKFRGASTWRILRGNGTRKSFAHGGGVDKKFRSFAPATMYQRQVDYKGNPKMLNIPVYEWSNLSVKDHLNNLMQGGPAMPKFIALSRDQLPPETQSKEVGECTYERQMQNEYRARVGTRDMWVEANPNVHYRDCECECLVLLDMGGYLGLPAQAEGVE